MRDYAGVILWGGVAIGAILAAAAVVWIVRRRLRGPYESGSGPVFTLQDLREMRARGDLTEAEFARMRDALLATASAPAGRDEASAAGGPAGTG